VPGDLVRVTAGDLIPADGKLVESRDLYVQQAALTGESLPAEKEAHPRKEDLGEDPEAPNLLFLGTSVVSGSGTAVILKTGPHTAFGSIAERLSIRPEETDFERSMSRFSLLVMRAVFFLVLFILVARVALHKDAFESFVFCRGVGCRLDP
jgi:P-type Mg2+ transporter